MITSNKYCCATAFLLAIPILWAQVSIVFIASPCNWVQGRITFIEMQNCNLSLAFLLAIPILWVQVSRVFITLSMIRFDELNLSIKEC
jgi:hypothetical protein